MFLSRHGTASASDRDCEDGKNTFVWAADEKFYEINGQPNRYNYPRIVL